MVARVMTPLCGSWSSSLRSFENGVSGKRNNLTRVPHRLHSLSNYLYQNLNGNVSLAALGYFVGTRCFSSSNQFKTKLIR